MNERRWCGTDYPRWEADSLGRVYRDGVEVEPCLKRNHLYVSNGNGEMVAVHKLVALAFHGQCPDDAVLVCHWNDVGTDNRPMNLYWGDHQDNARDRWRNAAWKAGVEPDWTPLSDAIIALRQHAEADPRNLDELSEIAQRRAGC